ncbi:phosphomannomutase/phosphoglucomutase [Neomoorella thermoacetica]|uniref:phosphomannomutase/phosphoglucomutase n=1 Tax=Neomoorella thermoacetica TaxID=1525 RepID=UPI0008FBB52D|nr:phosphomannomutase/phosphoglucomutase [Moorella thermoacetica]APC07786.1 phosphomannomutase/phosphoglucomutase [Moorella thermoacetica]
MNPLVFRAYDIRGKAKIDFPPDEVKLLGRSLATYFNGRGEKDVIVARDNRSHSPFLRESLIEGLMAGGCRVVDVGENPTPVFYFSHHYYGLTAGVMITASHNPPEDNGFKISSKGSTIYGEEIQKVRRIIEEEKFVTGEGYLEERDPRPAYIECIKERVKLTRPLKVVVDAGNGVAGPLAVELLKALGCQVIPLYCEPDSSYPHHHPDPTIPANLTDLKNMVLSEKADVGLALDGDGDRLGVVDEKGNILWGDMLQILFWREILPKHPGAPAIVEVKCSQALVEEIERLGGRPFFYKTGHSLIKAKMREIGALFTGEMSGHFFFADEYYGYDDALYAAARLLRLLSREERPLSVLLASVPRYCATPETRIPCADEYKAEVVSGVTGYFKQRGYEVIDVDGARVIFPGGWGLVRASNTQPVLVARCEARTREELQKICATIKAALMDFPPVSAFEWELP